MSVDIQLMRAFFKRQLPLWLALILAAPVLFFQAFRSPFPSGYAGMFTLIAEKIAQADFALPFSIPHYGPGGIDLVYPPLGMYLFALALKLGVPTWFYLRLAPALFTLLAVVPLYFLALSFTESRKASLVSVLLVMTAPAVYHTHVWSAGVVRAPALIFCLAGLFFYLQALQNPTRRNWFLSGLFLGLLLMTHWLYILFAALVGLAALLSGWQMGRLRSALIILAIALLVASPWLSVIFSRHGLESALLASSSHRNADFLLSVQQIPQAAGFFLGNLKDVLANPFLTALSLLGGIVLLLQKKFFLPLAFALILSMGEASFYSEILAGLMAGVACVALVRFLRQRYKHTSMAFRTGILVLAGVVLGAAGTGWIKISDYRPEISADSLSMSTFVRENTDPQASYLFIGTINEAEWYPYLFDRTPVFALWGSEWKGIYAEQLSILESLRACQLKKSWSCMEELTRQAGVSPNLLVIPNQRWLVLQVKDTHAWKMIYSNDQYLVWQKLP